MATATSAGSSVSWGHRSSTNRPSLRPAPGGGNPAPASSWVRTFRSVPPVLERLLGALQLSALYTVGCTDPCLDKATSGE
jgi:hypothetical protein